MLIPELVSIRVGDSICTLCPALGGSIIGWSINNQEMLRHADAAAIASGEPLSLASFPLVPFSNRIGYARFTWEGRQIEIARNFAPEPHAIHGVGWKDAWEIVDKGDRHIVLHLHHEADARWPWSFAATQSYHLENGSLTIKLSAANLANEPAPLAFGHHPYFDQEHASLSFVASGVLMNGVDALPTDEVSPEGQFDFRGGGDVHGRDIDHCYAGWDGRARISWAGRPLALEITADMKAAVVYIPKDGSAFCFEPVPHINNAINRPQDLPNMRTISPGASLTNTICLTATKA
jgi:aldose 1-epimerase